MREGISRAGLYHGGSGGFAGACVGCTRVLQSMEPTVVGMSMKEVLRFERSITNPAGIEWVIGSGANVGADLYMVAPVGSESVPSPSALYQLDPLSLAALHEPTHLQTRPDGLRLAQTSRNRLQRRTIGTPDKNPRLLHA